MGKFKGRNAVACIPCHSQKVKCNGEAPCERCIQKRRECTYPEKKPKLVSVPENYISELERDAGRARDSELSTSKTLPSSNPKAAVVFDIISQESGTASENTRFENESSTERFVHRLKELTLSNISTTSQATPPMKYTSLRGEFDDLVPGFTIKLPPMPLALRLFEKFEEVFCDCHWFMRRAFKEQLYIIYSNSAPQISNRKCVCRVSLVFALAATFMYDQDSHELSTYTNVSSPEIAISWDSPLPPGFGLFKQARQLLVTFSEEPSTEDIEILNLMAFYCYTLNRRRTAFLYIHQSVALAKLLQLDKPPSSPILGSLLGNAEDTVVLEHHKRLWWTCVFMDRMISSELGLTPAQATFPVEITPPSSRNISPDDLDQFFDPDLFELQIRICELKLRVARIEHLLQEASEYHEGIVQSLKESLESLQEFRVCIPGHMSFDFSGDFPATIYDLPWARGIATLYLRYHQCYTVLLRPIYYKHLEWLFRCVPNAQLRMVKTGPVISYLEEKGIQSARNNCRIILDLFHRGRNARYGYWDSAHLFSGLVILSLSRIVTRDHENNELSESDNMLYTACRTILHDMASAGNPSAKDHMTHLADVESIVSTLMSGYHFAADDSDILPWMNFELNERLDGSTWPYFD